MRWLTVLAIVAGSLFALAPAPQAAAGGQIKEITVSQLREWTAKHVAFPLIDVREENEWRSGHAAKAIHIPRQLLPEKIGTVASGKAARIVLYCQGGVRSAAAAAVLQDLGYTNVFSLAGGFREYEREGLPVEK